MSHVRKGRVASSRRKSEAKARQLERDQRTDLEQIDLVLERTANHGLGAAQKELKKLLKRVDSSTKSDIDHMNRATAGLRVAERIGK